MRRQIDARYGVAHVEAEVSDGYTVTATIERVTEGDASIPRGTQSYIEVSDLAVYENGAEITDSIDQKTIARYRSEICGQHWEE